MMKLSFVRLTLFILFIAAIIALRLSGLADCITLTYIRNHSLFLTDFISNNYLLSVLIYIGFFIFLVTFSLPLTIILTISSGFFYGVLLGTLYSNIGATIGSLFSFLATRYLIGDFIRHRYEKAYQAFNDRFKKDGISYLLSLNLFPVTPFFLINTLAGLSSIPVHSFVLATAIGVLPGCLVYAFAGRQFNHISTPSDLLSVPVMSALALLALLSLLPLVVSKLKPHWHHND